MRGPIFLHTSPIGKTEVNCGNRLLWVIEDQSHQKWVMKKKRLGTTALSETKVELYAAPEKHSLSVRLGKFC